jgi:hypothetical protein
MVDIVTGWYRDAPAHPPSSAGRDEGMRRGVFRQAAFAAALLLAAGCGAVVPGTAERLGGPAATSASSASHADPDGVAPQTVTWMTHTCTDLLSVDGVMAVLPVADPADPVTYRSAWSVYYSGLATAAGLAANDMDSIAPPVIPNGGTVADGLVEYLGQMRTTAQEASQLVAASSLDEVGGTVAAESAAMTAVDPADYGLAALDQGQLKQLQSTIPACRQFLQSGGG